MTNLHYRLIFFIKKPKNYFYILAFSSYVNILLKHFHIFIEIMVASRVSHRQIFGQDFIWPKVCSRKLDKR